MLDFKLPENSIDRDAMLIELMLDLSAMMDVTISLQRDILQLRDDYPPEKFNDIVRERFFKFQDTAHKSLKIGLQLDGVLPIDDPDLQQV
jgi:hypothetical protein